MNTINTQRTNIATHSRIIVNKEKPILKLFYCNYIVYIQISFKCRTCVAYHPILYMSKVIIESEDQERRKYT